MRGGATDPLVVEDGEPGGSEGGGVLDRPSGATLATCLARIRVMSRTAPLLHSQRRGSLVAFQSASHFYERRCANQAVEDANLSCVVVSELGDHQLATLE